MKLKLNKLFFLVGLFFNCASGFSNAIAGDLTSFYQNFEGVKLTDQNGRHFGTELLDSKISLFNFIYTECVSVCSLQTTNLQKVYQSLSPEVRKDMRFVSVSLDPIKDNPKKLKKFARQFKSDIDGWYFLSTNFQDLTLLTSKLELFKVNREKVSDVTTSLDKKTQENQLENHLTDLWLIDRNGHMIQRYVGNPLDTNRLLKELESLHQMQFKSSLK